MKTNTIYYSYFKPFKTGIGGTITGISKKTARSIIRKYKLEYEKDEFREKAVRRFVANDRKVITFYI